MDYELFFETDITILIILIIYLLYRIIFIIGRHEIFEFKDKRKSSITLHLKFLSVPKNFSEKKKLLRSFFSTLDYLYANGYEEVNFRTHLLKESRNISLRNILTDKGYTITEIFSLKTSLKEYLWTRLSMIFSSKEKRKISETSWDVTIKLR